MRPIIAVFILLGLLGSACAPVAQVGPVPAIAEVTETPPFIATPLSTATFLPTATLFPTHTPTVVPTLDPIRSTPPTLMLHRPSLQFDSVAFLRDFVQILQKNNMKVVTYRDLQGTPISPRPNKAGCSSLP